MLDLEYVIDRFEFDFNLFLDDKDRSRCRIDNEYYILGLEKKKSILFNEKNICLNVILVRSEFRNYGLARSLIGNISKISRDKNYDNFYVFDGYNVDFWKYVGFKRKIGVDYFITSNFRMKLK